MKKENRLFAMFLAVVLILSMNVTAFADETYSITIKNDAAGHTYEAYQIFTGELSDKVLSDVKWGTGQTDHPVGSDATEAAENLNESNVEEFAKTITLGAVAGTSTKTDNGYVIDGLAPGYYLVKDQDNSLSGNDAYTKYIVKVVGNAVATAKSVKPTVDKLVLDEAEDAELGSEDGWGKTADHAFNETFQFKLIANIPDDKDLDAYSTYKLVFHDTMSAGITFESIESVKVTANDDNTTVTDITDYVSTAAAGQAGGDWSLTIADLKAVISDIKGAKVEVIYNAHLNENAVVGNNPDNRNDVYLEYSNNPNADGTGTSEKDSAWVFSYMLDNTKVDGNTKEPLAGAGFRLYDTKGNEIALIFDNDLNGYRPVKDGESGEEMFSTATTGKFNIYGLDAGSYILKETTVPKGYNSCDDIIIVINAVHNESEDRSSAVTIIRKTQNGSNANSGVIVENNKGSVLPETGGMGTVIFYVIGGILVIGAVVLFITKKRMSAAE